MEEKTIVVPTIATARIPLLGLVVSGELFGRTHAFEHAGRHVKIHIPDVEIQSDGQPTEEALRIASFYSGIVGDTRPEKTQYSLNWLEISIAVEEQIEAPPELMTVPPVNPFVAGDRLTIQLNNLVEEYEERLARARDHWESVVRWVSGSSALGTPDFESPSSGLDFVSLERATDGRRYWMPGGFVTLMRSPSINLELWQAVGVALRAGGVEPIWFRYLDEAYHRLTREDLTGSILACAISCETIAKDCVWAASGSAGTEGVRELLDRLSIRDILDRWPRLTGITKVDADIKIVIKLFETRNNLMHEGGRKITLDRRQVTEFIRASRNFISRADVWYFEKQGLENYRLHR